MAGAPSTSSDTWDHWRNMSCCIEKSNVWNLLEIINVTLSQLIYVFAVQCCWIDQWLVPWKQFFKGELLAILINSVPGFFTVFQFGSFLTFALWFMLCATIRIAYNYTYGYYTKKVRKVNWKQEKMVFFWIFLCDNWQKTQMCQPTHLRCINIHQKRFTLDAVYSEKYQDS